MISPRKKRSQSPPYKIPARMSTGGRAPAKQSPQSYYSLPVSSDANKEPIQGSLKYLLQHGSLIKVFDEYGIESLVLSLGMEKTFCFPEMIRTALLRGEMLSCHLDTKLPSSTSNTPVPNLTTFDFNNTSLNDIVILLFNLSKAKITSIPEKVWAMYFMTLLWGKDVQEHCPLSFADSDLHFRKRFMRTQWSNQLIRTDLWFRTQYGRTDLFQTMRKCIIILSCSDKPVYDTSTAQGRRALSGWTALMMIMHELDTNEFPLFTKPYSTEFTG